MEHKHIWKLWLRLFCVKMPAFSFLYSSCVLHLEVKQENLAFEWNHHCCTVIWKDVTKCSDIYKPFDCQGWLDALVRQRNVYCFFVGTVKETATRSYVISRKEDNKSEICMISRNIINKVQSTNFLCLLFQYLKP